MRNEYAHSKPFNLADAHRAIDSATRLLEGAELEITLEVQARLPGGLLSQCVQAPGRRRNVCTQC